MTFRWGEPYSVELHYSQEISVFDRYLETPQKITIIFRIVSVIYLETKALCLAS